MAAFMVLLLGLVLPAVAGLAHAEDPQVVFAGNVEKCRRISP
jgi:hypothetical protein